MATALDTTREIQDKVFAGIETSQKAVVDVVKSWAETVELTFSKLPELAAVLPNVLGGPWPGPPRIVD